MSKTRKQYMLKLIGRSIIFVYCILIYIFYPQYLNVLNGWNFFKEFSPLHLLWVLWCIDMVLQIIPIKNELPLGSQKLFANRFKPIREKINKDALKKHIKTITVGAYKVFLLWCLLIGLIAFLYYLGIIEKEILFLISVCFYVCDLICVLIWCPFRLIMRNKCCTTCRIFNWDHLMMFSPFVFAGGFYALSLFIISVIAWFVWELFVMIYPERFWEITNISLKCSECTDKLCTQYCQKLRKK